MRGRRLRSRRRVLLAKRELTLEISDALGLLGDLALAKQLTQWLKLLLHALISPSGLPFLGLRHASDGTPIRSVCTAP
jgi:hypothetical protein